MRRAIYSISSWCLLSLLAPACAQERPSPGAALLFAKGDGSLSVAVRDSMYQVLGLALDSAGTGFVLCDQPAGAEVTFSDWNGDGVPEVLVIYGNSCNGGMTGSAGVLFIRDSAGAYQPNFGFPAYSVEPQKEGHLGYPDLLIGGPGFCFPIWRWDGTAYQYLRQEAQAPGGCDYH